MTQYCPIIASILTEYWDNIRQHIDAIHYLRHWADIGKNILTRYWNWILGQYTFLEIFGQYWKKYCPNYFYIDTILSYYCIIIVLILGQYHVKYWLNTLFLKLGRHWKKYVDPIHINISTQYCLIAASLLTWYWDIIWSIDSMCYFCYWANIQIPYHLHMNRVDTTNNGEAPHIATNN